MPKIILTLSEKETIHHTDYSIQLKQVEFVAYNFEQVKESLKENFCDDIVDIAMEVIEHMHDKDLYEYDDYPCHYTKLNIKIQ